MSKVQQARTALVTGGGGGIGRVSCLAFAKAGYRVAVCDHQLAPAEAVVAAIRDLGGEALAIEADVGSSDSVQQMVALTRTHFGRLDAAFNNAGQASPRVPLAEVSEADWERVIRTNLTGVFLCMKYQILAMLEQGGGGCIVNNSSIYGVGGGINTPYGASKHGVTGLTKSAAIAYAEHGIRINGVCPGLIEAGLGLKVLARPDAEITLAGSPAKRAGSAEEVADAVLWLCSEHASFVHGHMLAVDGGYGARG